MKRLLFVLLCVGSMQFINSAYAITGIPISQCKPSYQDYTSCNSGYYYVTDATTLPRRHLCVKCPDSGITLVSTGEPLLVLSAGGTSSSDTSCYITVSEKYQYADETGVFEFDMPGLATFCYYEH